MYNYSMNILIRPYQDLDENSVRKLIQELKEHENKLDNDLKTNHEAQEATFKEIITPLNEDRGEIYVAELDNQIIGFIAFNIDIKNYIQMFNKIPVVFISDIIVTKDFRNKGIGKLLLTKAQEFARQHNIKYLKLTVLSNNTATKLYKDIGFNDYEITMLKNISSV